VPTSMGSNEDAYIPSSIGLNGVRVREVQDNG